MFGDECMFCNDNNGCAQCKSGYRLVTDSICGIKYCIHESCPTPKPTPHPTRKPSPPTPKPTYKPSPPTVWGWTR